VKFILAACLSAAAVVATPAFGEDITVDSTLGAAELDGGGGGGLGSRGLYDGIRNLNSSQPSSGYRDERANGVGRHDPPESSPSVDGYTRDGKTTSTVTLPGDPDDPDFEDKAPISIPAK